MNRRRFLGSGSLGWLPEWAAGSAPGVVRSAIWGTRHSHTAGKLKAMQDSSSYQVVGVCESDAEARRRAQSDSRFQGLRWMTEAQLLSDPSIQLIVVECHVWEALPMGQKVIAAGKHLHLEKPPGNQWAPFEALVEEARSKKLLLQTGYVWRCHEGVNAALDAARRGWLGEVLMVRGTINSDRDAAQRAIEARYKGGGMFELGGHVIDRVVELLGRPRKVHRWLRHDTSIADQLADNNLAVLEYDRTLAVIAQSARVSGAGDHRSFEIIGTDGTFLVWPESSPPKMRVHTREARGPYTKGWQEITLPPQPRFVGDFAELARAILSGRPLRLSYEHELLVHETLLRVSGELA